MFLLPKDHILLLIPILNFNYQNWNFLSHQKIAFYCWFQFCCQFHLFIFPPSFATKNQKFQQNWLSLWININIHLKNHFSSIPQHFMADANSIICKFNLAMFLLPKDHILLLIPILSFNYQNWNFVLHQKIAFYCWFQFCCQFHLFIFPPAFATFIEFQNLHYSTILRNYFDSNKMYPIIYINSNNTKCTKVVVVTKGIKVLLFTNTNTKCTKVEPHHSDHPTKRKKNMNIQNVVLKNAFFFFEKAWLAKPPCKSEFFVIFVECWKTLCAFCLR